MEDEDEEDDGKDDNKGDDLSTVRSDSWNSDKSISSKTTSVTWQGKEECDGNSEGDGDNEVDDTG